MSAPVSEGMFSRGNTASMGPLVWDLKDGDEGPLLGRLRGVESRHELRDYDETIYAKPDNAHFVMRRSVTEWPDVLTNAEHLLVVSEALRDTVAVVNPKPPRSADCALQSGRREARWP